MLLGHFYTVQTIQTSDWHLDGLPTICFNKNDTIILHLHTFYQSQRRHLPTFPSFLSQLNQSLIVKSSRLPTAERLYQHRTTKYTNHHNTRTTKVFATHISYIVFIKNILQNCLTPFQGPQGLLPTIFEFPFPRYIPSKFFPHFYLNSHFLLHCIQPPDNDSTHDSQ